MHLFTLKLVLHTPLAMVLLASLVACSNHDTSGGVEEVIVYGIKASSAYYEPELAPPPPHNNDQFQSAETNPIKQVSKTPVSTFSADVDTASYTYTRQRLNDGYLPSKDAVRLEEFVNYFDYAYPLPPSKDQPFSASTLVHDAPWAADRKLIHIGIQGFELEPEARPNSNLVFLLDVSGSMNEPNKLPLVKQSMELLLSTLKPTDTIAIAVYAGAAGVVLEPTPVAKKSKILEALNKLSAGGSTAGGAGIQLAYQLAEENFREDAVNRILLATDGDFNVGAQSRDDLLDLIERKRNKGIYLSVLGFGQGNYRDDVAQTLAQNGNGVAAYIDSLGEAQKVLVHQATSALFPIANDLKFQIEFNPQNVREYRLLGYETRLLKQEDFNNDKVDAGDIGSGHSVTAIYEVILTNTKAGFIDDLRYQAETVAPETDLAKELAFLKIRYKHPGEDTSQLMTFPIFAPKPNEAVDKTLQREVNFATAVAGFAQLLGDDKYLAKWSYDESIKLGNANKGPDQYGYRAEFVQLVRKAKTAKSEK